MRLYGSLGFKEIDPYRFNPDPTTKYMELSLSDSSINPINFTNYQPIP